MSKKAESTLKNMFLSLTLISVVAAAALALVSNITAEPIKQTEMAKKGAAVKAVLPPFESVQEIDMDGTLCSCGVDAQGQPVGYAIESSSEKGFGGRLTAMVGFDTLGNVTGYQILQSGETPGLGAKADLWFQKDGKGCVIGKNPGEGLKVKKDGGDVDAISGSTITSRAFCELINNAYVKVSNYQKGDNE